MWEHVGTQSNYREEVSRGFQRRRGRKMYRCVADCLDGVGGTPSVPGRRFSFVGAGKRQQRHSGPCSRQLAGAWA